MKWANCNRYGPDATTRFWNHVDKTPGQGPKGQCWIWKGGTTGKGYGLFWYNGKQVLAHRFAWQLEHGPTDLCVLHECDNPPCVRCLFTGTHRDNSIDAQHKKRFPAQQRTHCPQGHEYTPSNTHIDKNGHRNCRTCPREYQRKKRGKL
jgi:hypothetical protein